MNLYKIVLRQSERGKNKYVMHRLRVGLYSGNCNLVIENAALGLQLRGERGRLLPYMGYIGMCGPKG